jgi:CRP-like cAMP-binding protein
MITPDTLSKLSLFAELTEEQLAPLAELAEEVSCPAGQVLFSEGARATQLYVLAEGQVSIEVQLSSRPENLRVAMLTQPGQLVGWSGVLTGEHYTASAVCQSPSKLLAFDGHAFLSLMGVDCQMGFTIMHRIAEVISGRLRNVQRVVLKTL